MQLSTSLILALSVLGQALETCVSGDYELIDSSSRPASRNCETKGRLVSPQVASTSQVASLTECITACKTAAGGCTAFGYTSANGTCNLYNKRLIDMKYRQKTTDFGTVFSNAQCYECKACPTNAIRNGGFDQAVPGHDDQSLYWTFALTRETDASNYIVRSMDTGFGYVALEIRINDPALMSEQASLVQDLSCIIPGVPYQLSFDFAGSASTLRATLDGVEILYHDCPGGGCGPRNTYLSDIVTPTTVNPRLEIDIRGATGVLAFLDSAYFNAIPQTPS